MKAFALLISYIFLARGAGQERCVLSKAEALKSSRNQILACVERSCHCGRKETEFKEEVSIKSF